MDPILKSLKNGSTRTESTLSYSRTKKEVDFMDVDFDISTAPPSFSPLLPGIKLTSNDSGGVAITAR
jgi:hypothetical protein